MASLSRFDPSELKRRVALDASDEELLRDRMPSNERLTWFESLEPRLKPRHVLLSPVGPVVSLRRND
jgi:hypothetical protein